MSDVDESASTEAEATARLGVAARVSLGAVLARSFAFYLRHLPALFVVGAVCFLPHLLLQWELVDRVRRGAPMREVFALVWPLLGLTFLLPLFVQGAVTLAVFQHLRGEGVRFARSVARGVLSLPSVLGIFVLLALALAGVILLASIPAGILHAGAADRGGVGLFVSLGVLTLVAFVICVYFVAVQAATVEGIGPWRAMGRSRSLTRGARWRIFALLVLVIVARWLAGLVVHGVLLGPATSVAGARLYLGIDTGLNVLFATLAAVWTAVVYHDLRRAKEGVGIEELLRVFE